MVSTFEEATEEIEDKLGQTIEWFKKTYPENVITVDAEYRPEILAYQWTVAVSQYVNGPQRATHGTYTKKTHAMGFDIFDQIVPRYKKAITEAMEAPWEEPI